MDPFIQILVVGVAGGVVIAGLSIMSRRTQRPGSLAGAVRQEPLGSDVINVSSIRVAGVGGLGLVVMALVVALSVPRIGQTLAVGFVLGVVFAAALVVLRRRQGPLPSSGRGPGANTILAIDAPAATTDPAPRDSSSMIAAPVLLES